ncbi:hypothetical protein [Nonomuraea sp. NBC_00507]|uniref:hypothetical protein n=1 Tax=Nonomuraea sp. NBC_00507 TaxID=2976002 RepID=UPI003FA5352E
MVAVFFAGMGVYGLVAPGTLVAPFGIRVPSAGGRNEVRAVYGGFGSPRRRRWHWPPSAWAHCVTACWWRWRWGSCHRPPNLEDPSAGVVLQPAWCR